MSSDSGSIVPLVMGILIFAGSLAMIISVAIPSITPPNDNGLPPIGTLGASIAGMTPWIPVNGHNVTSVNTTNDYHSMAYGHPANSNYVTFTDPAYSSHVIDVRIIRNSTSYTGFGGGLETQYIDYIFFDGYHESYLGMHLDFWQRALSYEQILSRNYQDNYSRFDLDAYNLSVMIFTPGNHTEFSNDLYDDNYTILIIQGLNIDNGNFWSILWSIISFNTSWMSSNIFIANLISLIVDTSLVLAALIIFQGFWP